MSNTINQRYELTRILGQGGYGAVFEAQDIVLNRRVALKRLHGGAFGAQIKERFLDEARITSSLRHPSALVMYDFGITQDGDPFLVTELLQGLSLQSYLESRSLSEAQTVLMLEQVGGALIEAHRQGIIHRDIKPANLFVHTPTGVLEEGGLMVKLLDFGIAKVLSKPAGTGTRSGSIIGTPAYMAPEQIRDSSKVDVRCDQYSLGLVAYECLLGRPAVTGRDEFEVMSNQINAPLPALDLSAREVSEAGLGLLVELITRMTRKDQAERFDGMSEVLEELSSIRRLHPELSDARLDPTPLIEQLKGADGAGYSSESALSFEQLSSSRSASGSVTEPPAPAPRVADSLSETIGADEGLDSPRAYDSLAETLVPDETPPEPLEAAQDSTNVSLMATLLPSEERSESAERSVAARAESRDVEQRATDAAQGAPQQTLTSAALSARLIGAGALVVVLFTILLVNRRDEQPVSADTVNRQAAPPLRLGPKGRSKASKYKVMFDRPMPPNGFRVGDEVEVLVKSNLGHQVLDYKIIATPPCLRAVQGADSPRYVLTEDQCGDIEVKVGATRLIGSVVVDKNTEELIEQLIP